MGLLNNKTDIHSLANFIIEKAFLVYLILSTPPNDANSFNIQRYHSQHFMSQDPGKG